MDPRDPRDPRHPYSARHPDPRRAPSTSPPPHVRPATERDAHARPHPADWRAELPPPHPRQYDRYPLYADDYAPAAGPSSATSTSPTSGVYTRSPGGGATRYAYARYDARLDPVPSTFVPLSLAHDQRTLPRPPTLGQTTPARSPTSRVSPTLPPIRSAAPRHSISGYGHHDIAREGYPSTGSHRDYDESKQYVATGAYASGSYASGSHDDWRARRGPASETYLSSPRDVRAAPLEPDVPVSRREDHGEQRHDESGDDESIVGGDVGQGERGRRARKVRRVTLGRGEACAACRLRKLKCGDRKPCENCMKAGIECKFEEPSQRKTKTAQMEDTIAGLNAQIATLQGSGSDVHMVDRPAAMTGAAEVASPGSVAGEVAPGSAVETILVTLALTHGADLSLPLDLGLFIARLKSADPAERPHPALLLAVLATSIRALDAGEPFARATLSADDLALALDAVGGRAEQYLYRAQVELVSGLTGGDARAVDLAGAAAALARLLLDANKVLEAAAVPLGRLVSLAGLDRIRVTTQPGEDGEAVVRDRTQRSVRRHAVAPGALATPPLPAGAREASERIDVYWAATAVDTAIALVTGSRAPAGPGRPGKSRRRADKCPGSTRAVCSLRVDEAGPARRPQEPRRAARDGPHSARAAPALHARARRLPPPRPRLHLRRRPGRASRDGRRGRAAGRVCCGASRDEPRHCRPHRRLLPQPCHSHFARARGRRHCHGQRSSRRRRDRRRARAPRQAFAVRRCSARRGWRPRGAQRDRGRGRRARRRRRHPALVAVSGGALGGRRTRSVSTRWKRVATRHIMREGLGAGAARLLSASKNGLSLP